MNRRGFLIALAGLTATKAAEAAGSDAYDLVSDGGSPLRNERVPSDIDPYDLPGAVWTGASNPDVTLIEFFDYNCPFCRGAAADIDAAVRANRDLQLRLFNNAILSPQSVEAAKVQQAVLRAYGPHVAYAFHLRLLAVHGVADRAVALATAKELGLDLQPVLFGASLPRVAAVVQQQMDRAKILDLTTTPSFVLDGVEVMGWPGPKELASMIASVRACDQPVCTPRASHR